MSYLMIDEQMIGVSSVYTLQKYSYMTILYLILSFKFILKEANFFGVELILPLLSIVIQLFRYFFTKIKIITAIHIITKLKWDVFIKLVLLFHYKICQMKKVFFKVWVVLVLVPLSTFSQEKVDVSMMQKIREEGLNRSKVMDIAFNLTDKNGSRLTNSEGYMRAANYAKETLGAWGMENAMIDPWGEFGKGWDLQKMYLAMTAPYYKPLLAWPKTWTAGTKGLKKGILQVIQLKDSVSLMAYKGKLKNKIIIIDQLDAYKQSFKADAVRYTDEELAKMAAATPQGGGRTTTDTAQMRRLREQYARSSAGATMRVASILKAMAIEEGAIAMISTSTRNHDGTIFSQGGGAYKAKDPENFLDMALGIEDYNTLLRIAKSGTEVALEADVKVKFQDKDLQGYNVIAEIPGTDPVLKNEVVMIGAHLDSWQAGTGSTDNAAGSSVMMEVMRILKTIGVQPKRTIRIGLWSGEEQGLLGSRGYVKKTFMDASGQPNKAHEQFSAYYNIDNGTGKIRGIYLQGNAACANIFSDWFTPFNDLGAKTITFSNTGGTAHLAFEAVGLPGFQFIQDPIEYNTRTHHSNMDVYDHLIEDDLKQMATIVAAFVYNSAQRDAKLPRK
jgi:carboxypeptidase Q